MAKKRKVDTKAEPEITEPPVVSEEAPIEDAGDAVPEASVNEEEEEEEEEVGEEVGEEEENEKEETEAEAREGEDGEDDSDEETDAEGLKKLLEPFGKDQIVELLRDAMADHPDVLERIKKVAEVDPAHRKIFVHGLGWDTTAETLTNFFKKYGEIEDCNAVMDKISGKSKGYGFILFKHQSGARKALKQPQKKIGNRLTACQLASAGPVPATPPVSEYTQRKIYVSNVSADIDPQRLLKFFSKYGEIEEGPLGLDKQTGKPKGFALFVYKTTDSARKALEDPHKNFEGHILHCQKAIDGPKPGKPHYHQSGGNHHGFHRNENVTGGFGHSTGISTSGGAGGSHLMAGGLGFNQAAAAAASPAPLNPALGQALTALLASQGAGLGLTNVLASLSPALNPNLASAVNPTVTTPLAGNASHGAGVGAFGNQPGVNAGMYGNQGGLPYQNITQQSGGRSQSAGGPMGPYMGH
ncbi:UBP1-associated protein 2B [Nymphaea thermarum]|nr:UBP1-associated protein 2B [Nymphaea thermarum]